MTTRLVFVAVALAAAFLAGRRSIGAAASVEDEMAVVQPSDPMPDLEWVCPPWHTHPGSRQQADRWLWSNQGCARCGTNNHDTVACPFGAYTN